MPSPFSALTTLLVRLADGPRWVTPVASVVAVSAVAVVAGHQAVTPESASAETSAEAPTAGSAEAPQDVVAAATLRRTPVSRGDVDRTERQRSRPRLPIAPSDADQTVAAAETSTVNVPGQCLAWSREQAGIPSRYADAATAWAYATDKRVADEDPPAGAAVYWTGGSGGHGHIAISVGDGEVRSSDAGGYGAVGTITIEQLTAEWGLQYAGWSDSINGYRIPGVADA